MAKEKIKQEETKEELNVQPQRKPFEREELSLWEIESIVVVTDKENKFVTQIRFNCEDGQTLTHKPKAREEVKDRYKGLDILQKSSRSITLEEIPKKLYEYNKLLNEGGILRLMSSYTVMNTTDKENEPVSYPFMTGEDFDTSYPIDEDNKEIILEQ